MLYHDLNYALHILEMQSLFDETLICLLVSWTKNTATWAGEMAQRLPALAALAEGLVWFLASTWWLTTVRTSNSGETDALFWPPGAPGIHDTQLYVQAKYPHT